MGVVDLPVMPPVTPVLAQSVPLEKALAMLPDALVEPKWDGFRAIVFRDGDEVEIGSRGRRPLTRYFPELVEAAAGQLPPRCVVDGEIVVIAGEPGAQRLDWDVLAQRIHPAHSRVLKLASQTPAVLVVFDLLALAEEDLTGLPFGQRRARLEQMFEAGAGGPSVHLSQVTTDPAVAAGWFEEFEGAGLDGIVAKPVDAGYEPGRRTLRKVKHKRSADVVVIGYRIHKSGQGVGSLLLGLYTPGGELQMVGGSSAFSDQRRLELIDELEPLVQRDGQGHPVVHPGERNRFAAPDKNTELVVLRPELVVEVAYDQMEKERFRHTVQVTRLRVDREPQSCTYDQLDLPVAYDFGRVLTR